MVEIVLILHPHQPFVLNFYSNGGCYVWQEVYNTYVCIDLVQLLHGGEYHDFIYTSIQRHDFRWIWGLFIYSYTHCAYSNATVFQITSTINDTCQNWNPHQKIRQYAIQSSYGGVQWVQGARKLGSYFRRIVYMKNSNPVRLGADDTLFDKVIVQNIMTLNVLWNGNDK